MPANDITLYAVWILDIYDVTYVGNGGSPTPANQTQNEGTTWTFGVDPTRAGYTFDGWTEAINGSGTKYKSGNTSFTMPATNVTLYAQWTAITYSIIYDGNGATAGSAPTTQTGILNAIITVAGKSTLAKDGHTFLNWNTAANGTGTSYAADDKLNIPLGGQTLYAQWTANTYALTYDVNGGESLAPTGSTPSPNTIITVTNTVPTKDGYTFSGWNTIANGSGTSYISGNTFLMPNNPLTLYAQWTATTYLVTYNGNGGSTGISAKNYPTGGSVNIEGTLPTRAGYNFIGWTENSNGSGTLRTSSTNQTFTIASSNIIFYAKWEIATYELSYHKNSGTGTEPETVSDLNYGSLIDELENASQLTKAEFRFVGWNTAADGSGIGYSPGTSLRMPAQNLVLYAQWVIDYQWQENNADGENNNEDDGENSGGNNSGGGSTPQVNPSSSPSPTATNNSGGRGPGLNPGGGNAVRPSPTATNSQSGNNGNQSAQDSPGKKGPMIPINPMMPGIGGLINSLVAIPGSPAPSNPANGVNGNTNSGTTVVANTTVDLGAGVIELTTANLAEVSQTTTQGQRTLNQFGQEKLGGFHPPGSGVRIEVLGARSGARFVLSDAAKVDAKALLTSLNNSIGTQAADFFTINEVKSVSNAPTKPQAWTQEQQEFMDQFFAGAGLQSPRSLADLNYNDIFNWIGVTSTGETYVPGSTVYLTVTSEPLVIATATVDKFGKFEITGAMPVEFMAAGEHRIRLVGTRSLDGVFVDDQGEIQVTDQTLAEIKRFDLSTQATIGLIGTNISGGNHVAMRVIPLIPTAPWWTIALLVMAGFGAIWLRRNNKLNTKRKQIITNGVLVAATIPAVILGWLSTVTSVVWVGIALSIALNVATRVTRVKQKPDHKA